MQDLSNENVIHVKTDDVEYIQFRRLLEYKELVHCYTLRVNDLNFTPGETIIPSNKRICNALKLDYMNVVKPIQKHTGVVKTIDKVEKTMDLNNIDGLITNKKDIILSTINADCNLVIYYDPVKKVIANVHAGWRGVIQRITSKAVEKMVKEFGCNTKDIICCICPGLRKCHFEVDYDVESIFREDYTYTGRIDEIVLPSENPGKSYIDITLVQKIILEEAGIKKENIIDSMLCSVCNKEKINSLRGNGHNSGQGAALITMH